MHHHGSESELQHIVVLGPGTAGPLGSRTETRRYNGDFKSFGLTSHETLSAGSRGAV